MRIIVEANIPYIRGLLEKFGDVAYLPAYPLPLIQIEDCGIRIQLFMKSQK